MKDALLAKLTTHRNALLVLGRAVRGVATTQVRKSSVKGSARSLARQWFDEISVQLVSIGFSPETVARFSGYFDQLLMLSDTSSTKPAYTRLLGEITPAYQRDLIHQIEIGSFGSRTALNITPYIGDLPANEGDYLDEAQRCLTVDAIRACIVLGWCAVIARIHTKVEELGFDNFNKASVDMHARDYGRFKPFKKKFHVESISEMRSSVFDTDLLWVLEFMQLIDSNEHQRLRHCFDLRNHSAHPGEAPVVGENLYAFYSDISKIVLKNEKFALEKEK